MSYIEIMAEGEGFEPSIELTPYTELATQRLQPLGHPSAGGPFYRKTAAIGRGKFKCFRWTLSARLGTIARAQ